ncbi:MAG: adenylate kinase family enzyme [Patiriisocius sp.]|jgi:adenylate kinase family enzyme
MKITIVGLGGSGKTTLAKKISAKLNIPHIQLDRIWFEAGGHMAETESQKDIVRVEVKNQVQSTITQPSWVSDGFYSRVQPLITEQADQIILLDIPLYRRLANHLTRTLLQKDRHPEAGFWQDLLHTKTIIRRNKEGAKVMKEFKIVHQHHITILSNYLEIEKYLDQLK